MLQQIPVAAQTVARWWTNTKRVGRLSAYQPSNLKSSQSKNETAPSPRSAARIGRSTSATLIAFTLPAVLSAQPQQSRSAECLLASGTPFF